MFKQPTYVEDIETTPLTALITFSRMSLLLFPWPVIAFTLYLFDASIVNGWPTQVCEVILLLGIPALLDFFLPSSLKQQRRAKVTSNS